MSRLPFASIGPDRRPVIAGGLAILAEVMSELRIRRLHVADGAMREGVLYDLVGRLTSEDAREQTVRSMQARYHVDRAQAARVEKTALSLLRRTKRQWQLTDPLAERVLRWAARLHEIGLDLAHSGYHRHGAYLLENADMPGFPREEQRLLARLVRWHRRRLEFEDLADLGPEWRRIAERLIVLLRLAVLLHRNRSNARPPPFTLVPGRHALTLRFRLRSLRRHPLTHADLLQEQQAPRRAGHHVAHRHGGTPMSTKRTRRVIDKGPRSAAVVRRTLVRDVVTAAGGIPASGILTPEEVHDTRKRIKRARATLSLLRPAITEPDYEACNRALREAGRSLAAARDSTVMARTYATMRTRAGATRKTFIARCDSAARQVRTSPRPRTSSVPDVILHSAADRLAHAPLHGRGWAPLGSGLRAVYRRGRRRRRKPGSATSSEALHAWRRHAKRYWHVLERSRRSTRGAWHRTIADAHACPNCSGRSTTSACSPGSLRGQAAIAGAGRSRVLDAVADRRAKLTQRAMKLGNRLYADNRQSGRAADARRLGALAQVASNSQVARTFSRSLRTGAVEGTLATRSRGGSPRRSMTIRRRPAAGASGHCWSRARPRRC